MQEKRSRWYPQIGLNNEESRYYSFIHSEFSFVVRSFWLVLGQILRATWDCGNKNLV